jgi:hypothetical protein
VALVYHSVVIMSKPVLNGNSKFLVFLKGIYVIMLLYIQYLFEIRSEIAREIVMHKSDTMIHENEVRS